MGDNEPQNAAINQTFLVGCGGLILGAIVMIAIIVGAFKALH